MIEITLEEMLANMERRDDDVEYYIEGVLPGRGRYAAIGLTSHGKTTLACHKMLHVTSGREWMGKKTRPGLVLWLNLNDEPSQVLKNRMHDLSRGMELDSLPPNLMIVNQSEYAGRPFGMHDDRGRDNTYRVIDLWHPDILVIDSLRKFLPFKDQVMNVRPLQMLSNDYPAMVQYYIHHAQQKGVTGAQVFTDKDPASYFANSSDLARDVDGYFVVRGFVRNELLEHIALRAVSKRYLLFPRPMKIDVEFIRPIRIDPEHYGEPSKQTALKLVYGGLYVPELRLEQKLIVDILAKQAGDTGLSVSEVVALSETAVARSTVYRNMEELYEAGWVELVSRGNRGKRFYRLTEEAKKSLPAL